MAETPTWPASGLCCSPIQAIEKRSRLFNRAREILPPTRRLPWTPLRRAPLRLTLVVMTCWSKDWPFTSIAARVTGKDISTRSCARSILNCRIKLSQLRAIEANSCAAFCDSWARNNVPFGSLRYSSDADRDIAGSASRFALFRVISLVVALCSSTAAAMVAEMLLI
jgi:hypothetical protein